MKKLYFTFILSATLFFTGCYSVFNGGTGGLIVDKESTASPKTGIANVDVYAYTDKSIRNSDFNAWKEGSVFSPSNSYYGHTSTDANGNFTISKLVWKESKPDFGRDADYTTIYLLYYHENYGLTKDETVITSDSSSDTVYAELTSIRKSTNLDISLYNVADSSLNNSNILVTVSVPQTTDTLTAATPKVYKQIINGNGSIAVSYPRWKNAQDKAAGIENTPEVTIYYAQSGDLISWKACSNADNEAGNYAFLADNFTIKRTISNSSYSISLFGKACRLNFPSVSGSYGDTSSGASDGKIIRMKAKDSSGNYTIDCGEKTTAAQARGTNGDQTHGSFSGLGEGAYWIDQTYTEKYSSIEVQFYLVNGENESLIGSPVILRSNTSSYTVVL